MAGSSLFKLFIMFLTMFAIITPIIVLTSLSLSKVQGFSKCNTATCVPTKCNPRYCSGDTCVENPRDSCCEDESCDSVEAAEYNFGTLHTYYVNATSNTTLGVVANDILFRNGSVAGACLITDGTCTGNLGPTTVDTLITDFIDALNQTHCLDVDDKMYICPDGNITLNGSLIMNRINVSNLVCLDRALPYSGGFITINTARIGNGIVNATNFIVTGNITINTVTQAVKPRSVVVSGLLADNNTVQGYVGDTYSKLLINPQGGNVGLALVTNTLSDVIYTAQSGGASYVSSGMYFDNSKATNGGVQGPAWNTYNQSMDEVFFNGPWTSGPFALSYFWTRVQDVVTLTFTGDVINNCSGTPAPMVSTGTGWNPKAFPTGTPTIDARIRVINNSVEVEGVMKISYQNITISSTAIDNTGLGYINGTSTNLCGSIKASITYVL